MMSSRHLAEREISIMGVTNTRILRACLWPWADTTWAGVNVRRARSHLAFLPEAYTLRVWSFQSWRKQLAYAKMAKALERLEINCQDRRWVGELEWRACAAGDQVLPKMLTQFVTVFEKKRQELAEVPSGPAMLEMVSFDGLLSQLWARQQQAMAFLRWHRRPLPWVLGSWPVGPTALLATGSDWHMQAQQRLKAMLWQLE